MSGSQYLMNMPVQNWFDTKDKHWSLPSVNFIIMIADRLKTVNKVNYICFETLDCCFSLPIWSLGKPPKSVYDKNLFNMMNSCRNLIKDNISSCVRSLSISLSLSLCISAVLTHWCRVVKPALTSALTFRSWFQTRKLWRRAVTVQRPLTRGQSTTCTRASYPKATGESHMIWCLPWKGEGCFG